MRLSLLLLSPHPHPDRLTLALRRTAACSRPPCAALRSRPSRASFAHRALPPSHSFRAHIRRGLNNNTISGTIPDAFGQLTKLQFMCVSLLFSPRLVLQVALRRPAACSRTALRSRPPRVSFAHRAVPPSHSLHAHIHRTLYTNEISGTITDAIGELTELLSLCVFLLLLAPRPPDVGRAAPPRSLLAPSARRASFVSSTRAVCSPRSPPIALLPRAHSQGLGKQPDQRHYSRRDRPALED